MKTKIMTPPRLTRERREFALTLPLIMNKAHQLGLPRTGHKLHDAVRELGWEIADCETGKQHTTPTRYR